MRTPVVLILVALTACGKKASEDKPTKQAAPSGPSHTSAPPGGATESGPGKSVDACTLLTKADVDAATKMTSVDPVSQAPMANMSSCDFGDPDTPVVEGKRLGHLVRISVTSHGSAAEAKEAYEYVRKPNEERAEPIPGIGDSAYWNKDEAFRSLAFIKGPYEVDIEIGPTEGAREMAKTLAEKAVTKLP